ncbi:hypothetical protein QO002_005690 [Pararhizobium capsulatum DSM 1112]|uniref:Uncharacterized protein n=1 Tax=Pararhizobium capsulatum DSM 1112 TaxID=1121113 RepID=A0ABU0C0L1_9HYPH|nr:hypothetical protein [Pararhizobium capsulatum]MDQ0323484.1 hypothetical protein [Pararhizobium capsulatum DSM 1112]
MTFIVMSSVPSPCLRRIGMAIRSVTEGKHPPHLSRRYREAQQTCTNLVCCSAKLGECQINGRCSFCNVWWFSDSSEPDSSAAMDNKKASGCGNHWLTPPDLVAERTPAETGIFASDSFHYNTIKLNFSDMSLKGAMSSIPHGNRAHLAPVLVPPSSLPHRWGLWRHFNHHPPNEHFLRRIFGF